MKTHTSFFQTLCLLTVASLFTVQASAQKVSLSTAQQVAKNYFFLKNTNVSARSNVNVASMRAEVMDNDTLLYVFNMNPAGFVVVANEQKTQPILAYGMEATTEGENPAFDAWLENYKNQVNYIRHHKEVPVSEKNSTEWTTLKADNFSREGYQVKAKTMNGGGMNTASISPLLTTNWGQGSSMSPSYNYYCPTSSGSTAITGCVATAMAQVMRYYNHPAYGNGSKSYAEAANYDSNGNLTQASYGTLSANFGTTNYDWANMPATITSASPLAQRQAIGRLMSHAGISVSMDYAPWSSGASTPDAATSFANNFFYTNAGFLNRSSYTTANWKTLLKNALDASKPVLYRGRDNVDNTGHAWVCDGYDASDYFHMNWGWNGGSNGYFSVDDLTPGSNYFNDSQGAIINTPRYLTLSATTKSFCYSASSSTFTVSSNATAWTVTDNASWITVSPASGANNGTVTISVSANTGSTTRTGTVTVKGGGVIRTITVSQSGTPSITATANFYPGTMGAQYNISVASSGSFTVSDNATWITPITTSGTSATTTLSFTTSTNTTGATRTGIITLTGACGYTKTISVTQSYLASTCATITGASALSNSTTFAIVNCTATGSPTFYRIYYKKSTSATWVWYGSYATCPVTVSGLAANTLYNFKIEAACSSNTTSATSVTVSAQTMPAANSKMAEEVENVALTDGTPDNDDIERISTENNNTWNVYPNPANEVLNVTLSGANANDLVANMLDLSGRVVMTEKVSVDTENLQFELNVSQLPVGMYILTVKNGNELNTKKVQIVR